jgi:hypothetical protein
METLSFINLIIIGGDTMIYLILWEATNALMQADPQERMKLIMSHIEMTKKDLDSGEVKMWGISPGGGHGYSIAEGDAKELMPGMMKYTPYYKFEVKPMLSIDEVVDAMKSMQQ